MSEYWKSTPKYYCKHCKIYVVDTPLSRKNHDASLKHQGNLKRFLRDLHRNSEREKAAAENAKREVARLNALTGSGPSTSSSSLGSTPGAYKPRPPPPGPVSEAERKRQMKELEALGVALPESYRAEMAMVGEWKSAEDGPVVEREMTEKERVQEEIKRDLKRKFDEEEMERKWNALDEDEKALRGFTIRTKSYPGTEMEGAMLEQDVKGKGKEKIKEEEEEETKIKAEDEGSPPAVKVKEEVDDVEGINIKKEEDVPGDTGGVIFKKRKVKNIRKK
jgi:U1 zinc finger